MFQYMEKELGFNQVSSCDAGQCMRNYLQNFHTLDGLPYELAQCNFELCKHLSSASDLGHIDLAVCFFFVKCIHSPFHKQMQQVQHACQKSRFAIATA